MPVAEFAHPLQIPVGGQGKAGIGAGDGVHDDGGDRSGALPFQNRFEILQAGQRARVGIQAEFTAIAVRRHGVGEARQQGFIGLASACKAGRGERAQRGAVV